MNAFYTHREFLIQELDKLVSDGKPKKIFEFGIGDGSSEIFSQYCKNHSQLTVFGYESNEDWFSMMMDKYNPDDGRHFHPMFSNYQMVLYKKKNFQEHMNAIKSNYNLIDLLFVDQSPWEERIQTIDALGSISKTIILHDYDYYNHSNGFSHFSIGKTSFFKKYIDKFTLEEHHNQLPPTLIFRNKSAA